jgi:ABC-type antimicrobial peptide transport system permease subunit
MNLIGTRALGVAIDGYAPRRGEDLAFQVNTIGPDYFRTLRIPVLAGRPLEDRDDENGAPVVVVNNTLAQKFFGGPAAAIGKRLRVGSGDWRTIVGVAADVKYSTLNEPPTPFVYMPFFQAYRSSMTLQTRGTAPDNVLVEQARARIAALDPDLPLIHATPLTEQTRAATILLEFMSYILFVFGAGGMALAGLGIYGLVSYSVKQSTHEIGIRMALGADALSVVRDFLGRGLRLGAMGAVLGIVVALGVSRLLASVLFGVGATDIVSFTLAAAIVLGGVFLATIVPAWRASRTDPLSALRHQ